MSGDSSTRIPRRPSPTCTRAPLGGPLVTSTSILQLRTMSGSRVSKPMYRTSSIEPYSLAKRATHPRAHPFSCPSSPGMIKVELLGDRRSDLTAYLVRKYEHPPTIDFDGRRSTVDVELSRSASPRQSQQVARAERPPGCRVFVRSTRWALFSGLVECGSVTRIRSRERTRSSKSSTAQLLRTR